jgi:hypothetical protein
MRPYTTKLKHLDAKIVIFMVSDVTVPPSAFVSGWKSMFFSVKTIGWMLLMKLVCFLVAAAGFIYAFGGTIVFGILAEYF